MTLAYLYSEGADALFVWRHANWGKRDTTHLWFLVHFPKFYAVDPNTKYVENLPVAAMWKLQKGHGEGVTYRSLLDRITFDDVCWTPYEEHMDFQEVFWYSGWIMCNDRKVHRHLPDRVLRQYGYVQTVPRHPSDVVELSPTEIVHTFFDFRTHTLKAADCGEHAGEETWHMADGYVRWYAIASHSQILPLLPGDIPRPPNEEQIIAE
uniref:IMP dehydrogenase/GMP reductase, putative n=1 Tax=Medicago truncatula TaxID=3880 RepID=A2Q234_MEDTR|nr:IMP dehydrogenase/GMP reductase, putative [Medicago truncatula]